ncbi:MAG: hypothetical protein ABI616_00900 [Pseudomonadota bacterium]
MKKLFAALALVSAAYVASVQAADVGVSISIGQPGFYGQLDLGNVGRPQVVYRQPVLVQRRNFYPAPVYVRVPPYQYSNWRRYCGLYNACARPVYFVRDDWYRNVYAPRYYRAPAHGPAQPHGQPYAYRRYGHDDHGHDDRGRAHN